MSSFEIIGNMGIDVQDWFSIFIFYFKEFEEEREDEKDGETYRMKNKEKTMYI